MRRPRVIVAWTGASFALVLVSTSFSSSFFGCSSDDRPGSSSGTFVPQETGVPEAGPVADAAPLPPGYDGGVGLGLADVPETPCAARGGALAGVLPGGADASPAPLFGSLRKAGDRRVADAVDGSGFVVMDADGKNAKLVTTSLLGGGTAALGSQIVFAGSYNLEHPAVQTYDTSGAPVGGPVDLDIEDPEGLAVGADDATALVVWATATNKFRARGFTATGPAGAVAYNLAIGASVHTPSIAVSSVKSGLFAVVFSGDDTGEAYQTAFGRGSATARVGDPSNLFTGPVPRTVVGLARTPSGFALLVTVSDGPSPYAMLVLTDVGGRRTSPGLKLQGTLQGYSIAVNGSEIGVLAHRRDQGPPTSNQAVEFRAFDAAGAPLGPWVCLDAPGGERVLGGGLLAEGTGYAAIFRAADGSTSLARFDRLGTGAP